MTRGGYYSGEGQDIDLDKYRELMREYNANPNALRPRTVRTYSEKYRKQLERAVQEARNANDARNEACNANDARNANDTRDLNNASDANNALVANDAHDAQDIENGQPLFGGQDQAQEQVQEELLSEEILNSLVQEVNAAEADLNVLKSTKGKKKQKKRSAASELMSKTSSNLTTLWQKTLLKPETI